MLVVPLVSIVVKFKAVWKAAFRAKLGFSKPTGEFPRWGSKIKAVSEFSHCSAFNIPLSVGFAPYTIMIVPTRPLLAK